MAGLTQLIDEGGYAAIFLVVALGNLGLPIPRYALIALALATVLAWVVVALRDRGRS
ncbi:MAG TPA: hypothetical protein VMS64_23760 [Candidatus Methylomirabilis sp.]|nr:hypothetical protein [Candidatus Methylomirabilis sp.]